ncbi:MAG: hypothetical protein B6A08_14145 [Sorangiineae bacterium NIC37A_2]|nr:MAG: hypothetical protein B6A08_14145 [Sorangiineae bacterium NIC37A_2]
MARRLPWIAVLAGATAVGCALSPIQDLPTRGEGDSGKGGNGGLDVPGPGSGSDDDGLIGDNPPSGSGGSATGGQEAAGGQDTRPVEVLLGGGGAKP